MPSEQAIYLFREGTNARAYDDLGCHLTDGAARFAVWAPNATAVSVIGAWSSWDPAAHPLAPLGDASGFWQGEVAGVGRGDLYKFRIVAADGRVLEKADPFAFRAEPPPATASRAWTLEYDWGDGEWMAGRAGKNGLAAPLSIYEVHLGSWRRDQGRMLGYRELAPLLADYALEMGFTHVELMPITEHPFYGSWGYQTTGYFAPTARYGTPQDFMAFVDHLHQCGIGVLLDWVPSHFPTDAHGLAEFDGTHLFEHADPRQGFHPEWNSAIFNYGRNEVRSFLTSSGCFWLDKYHLDGLRVDAVASMLYLDYARKSGEWVPNPEGGKENLDAVKFVRGFNEAVYRDHPDTMTIAEESTAWPMVSRPTSMGGLGFGMKWNMGWMHDTLAYMSLDPIHRRHHHGGLTFSIDYAFNENFVLPLSHDEVVHGKGSLLGKMPGDEWRRFANLRALFGLMWTHPGKKLLFMGCEIAQRREWTHEGELEWPLAELPGHAGVQRLVADLNRLYRAEPALHELDFSPDGFEWVEGHDAANSVIAFLRKPAGAGEALLVVANLTPVQREGYRVGVQRAGFWREVLNSDAAAYGGSGSGNLGGAASAPVSAQGRADSLVLTLPALAVLVFRRDRP